LKYWDIRLPGRLVRIGILLAYLPFKAADGLATMGRTLTQARFSFMEKLPPFRQNEVSSATNSETRTERVTGTFNPKPAKRIGLCSTCNYADSCAYCADSRLPVLYCEEFDCSDTADSQNPMEATMGNGEDRPDIPLGLCSNCVHLEVCTYPKPEGGIWFCEEYE
jgi:hypothetical protein